MLAASRIRMNKVELERKKNTKKIDLGGKKEKKVELEW